MTSVAASGMGATMEPKVKERPIIFSAPMVRAILDGRKTQTRRLIKPQPHPDFLARGISGIVPQWPHQNGVRWFMRDGMSELFACPFGSPGERMWVREGLHRPDGDPWLYRADNQPVMVDASDETAMLVWAHHKEQDYCPSIHMPRWASRITLELIAVRVERLNDISEADATAEGAMFFDGRPVNHHGWRHDYSDVFATAQQSFAHLWEALCGPGSWAKNPFCWVLEFRRCDGKSA